MSEVKDSAATEPNETTQEITPEEIAQNMMEAGFMSNVLKGGLRTMGTPMLGATNPNATGESDEETGVIDVLDLEQGKAHNTVKLGRQGENNSQTVQFDCTAWLADFGEAEVSIVARRPGENNTYLVNGVSYADGTLTWTIATEDTDRAGCGEAEIRAVSGEKVKKSARFRTKIEKSVEDYTGGVVTPPYWAVDIISQAQTASEDAAAAARNSGIASSMATSAESAASDSEGSARRAEAAATEAAASAEAAAESAAIAELYAYNLRVNGQHGARGLVSVLSSPMVAGGINASTGEDDASATTARRSGFVPVQGGKHLLVRKPANRVRLFKYDSSKAFLRQQTWIQTAAKENLAALESDVAYIRIEIASVGDADVYGMDFGVFGGNISIPLTGNENLLNLEPGRYYATPTVAAGLTNCPVTGYLYMEVKQAHFSNVSTEQQHRYVRIIYAGNSMYVYSNDSQTLGWTKYTGERVTL